MSTYELDDDLVRAMLPQLRDLLGGTSAEELALRLDEQLPPKEPDKEYLVKDGRDKFWRWDARQVAWHCIQTTNSYVMWDTLVREHGPVTIYSEVS